ncbi:MAG: MFS transporter, partial [Micrococcaceae bacterium]|nr:MFS transporter [Micrococcaceae bacterium]
MLWAINFTSSMVGWSMGIALSVHIYQLTGSALWTAILAATPTVSAIVFGHLAGTVADRWNPLRVVQLTLLARVVVLLGLFVVAESPGWLAILVFVQAAVQQIYRPAEQVLIADFVSAEDLPEANGLNSFASNATRLVAPALGGFVIAVVGFGWTALGMTAFMACSAILSLTLGRWFQQSPPSEDAEMPDGSKSVGTYLKLLRRSPRARGLVLLQVLDAVKEGPLSALFPVLMLGVVGATSTEMGLANSAFAVSAVVAGPLIGVVIKRLGYQLTVVGGAAVGVQPDRCSCDLAFLPHGGHRILSVRVAFHRVVGGKSDVAAADCTAIDEGPRCRYEWSCLFVLHPDYYAGQRSPGRHDRCPMGDRSCRRRGTHWSRSRPPSIAIRAETN